MSIAHRWNVPKKAKTYKPSYCPVPTEGVARCLRANELGFVVGKVYRFHSKVEALTYPPYDVVTVERDDYSVDHPVSSWVFINNQRDLFRKAFKIL